MYVVDRNIKKVTFYKLSYASFMPGPKTSRRNTVTRKSVRDRN